MLFPGSIFTEMAMILAVSALLGLFAARLKQPLIVAFIAVGVLLGPAGFDLMASDEHLHLLAELGIAILLFVVGLKLDLHLIRTMGPVALATGLGQVLFTSVFGYLIGLALGQDSVTAIYVAVALTFSSTIIIVKLLSDKREIDSLHGRIAIGFLIVQDIAVILAMIGLTALRAADRSGGLLLNVLIMVLGKGALLLAAVAFLMRFVLPALMDRVARSQELLLLFAISWALLFAASSDGLGFSKEVGAFLAGISLASTAYREAISSRLIALRDFLLLFFFINLGSQLDFSSLGAQVGPALVFSLFVLVGNPIIVMMIMGFMGYRRRTGFLAGLTVAQISEFSLILIALGLKLGQVDQETLGLVTLVGLITIGGSTYLILYSHQIYEKIGPYLTIFERRNPFRESAEDILPSGKGPDVVLFGLGRYGSQVAAHLRSRGKTVFGVDFDPEVVRRWVAAGTAMRYGDAEDPELLEHLPLTQTPWVVSTIPEREASLVLLGALRRAGYKGKIALTAQNEEQARLFREAGADRVLWPYLDAAEQAVDVLTASREAIFDQAPWPMTLEEVRIRSGSVASGKRLGELELRQRTGATVVAVDRAGRSYFDPEADFVLFPGDRVVLLGGREDLPEAAAIFEQPLHPSPEESDAFRIEEIRFPPHSGWIGRTLADLDLRKRIGLTVIGIRRGNDRIVSPPAHTVLQEADVLVVLGKPDALNQCQVCLPLE